MKKLFKFLFLVMFSFMLVGCTNEENTIVMVTESGFAPYEYQENGEVVGVDVDIAREIAKHLDMKLVIKDVAFDSLINELNSDKADFAAAGMSITEDRKKNADFSIEYAASKQVIVVRKDYKGIKEVSELNGKKVSVQLGSVADSYVSEEFPNATVLSQKKFLAAAEDVKTGKSDCIVMDELPAKMLVKSNPEFIILDIEVFTDRYAIAVKKGNGELLTEINTVLTKLMEEGKIEEYIINHTYAEDPGSDSVFSGILDSLYQTLVVDARWKLIFEGLINTIIIALGAVVIGLFLGSVIALIKYTNKQKGTLKILNKLCSLYVTVIRGTPAVLQLMIMYYIIFKTSTINPVLIGILAFGLNSAAYCAEILRTGFDSIDRGQMEAGLSLGLTYGQTLRYVIIPQAVKVSLPAMGNEFITLIKETSIAGYIGIMDLTKASDIIASRTYDYLFPLVIVAIIYLTITGVLGKILRKVERKLDIDDTSK